MHTLTCQRCGCDFTHSNTRRLYCSECKEELQKQRTRDYMRKKRNGEQRKAQSFSEILAELEAYNKKHKTHLSYGQYVAMKGLKK